MPTQQVTAWKWLRSGNDAFVAMLAAIDEARVSICLESYIYSGESIGQRFRDALVRACQRGVRVHVLVDSGGSLTLPDSFWKPLRDVGGAARFFNPLTFKRFGIRDHRKVLVCDSQIAFVGGFNVAPEYEGDGVTKGWFDLGFQLEGPMAAALEASFHAMYALADFQHKRFTRFRRAIWKKSESVADARILLSGPGRGGSPISHVLHHDLRRAKQVQIIVAYFLPSWRLRRELRQVVRRGGSVNLVLAGKSDVLMSQLAAQSLYRRLLRSGVKIHEYQPQILHAKLFILDDIVYVGSANLDPRSQIINYELMLRFKDAKMADEAREIFNQTLKHSESIELKAWLRTRTFWARFKRRWAYFFLARVDPYMANRQWRGMRD